MLLISAGQKEEQIAPEVNVRICWLGFWLRLFCQPAGNPVFIKKINIAQDGNTIHSFSGQSTILMAKMEKHFGPSVFFFSFTKLSLGLIPILNWRLKKNRSAFASSSSQSPFLLKCFSTSSCWDTEIPNWLISINLDTHQCQLIPEVEPKLPLGSSGVGGGVGEPQIPPTPLYPPLGTLITAVVMRWEPGLTGSSGATPRLAAGFQPEWRPADSEVTPEHPSQLHRLQLHRAARASAGGGGIDGSLQEPPVLLLMLYKAFIQPWGQSRGGRREHVIRSPLSGFSLHTVTRFSLTCPWSAEFSLVGPESARLVLVQPDSDQTCFLHSSFSRKTFNKLHIDRMSPCSSSVK